jgi:uncharacterized secreted protein with C-terminal beta-propeller domain
MRWRGAPILALGLALAAFQAPALAFRHTAKVRPHAFASCARLVGYERAHFAATKGVPARSPRTLAEPRIAAPLASGKAEMRAAAPSEGGSTTGSGTSFSTTNNQELGVEEPDIVKSDGSTIFAVERGTLYAVAAGPIPHLVGSVSLGSNGYRAQLLIRGNRLLVISGEATPVTVGSPVRSARSTVSGRSPAASGRALAPGSREPLRALPGYPYAATTTVTEVDAQDPAAMAILRTMTLDGAFVDARQNGGTARLVISSSPPAILAPALRARVSGWVPRRRFHSFITGHRSSHPVASCSEVQRPVQFSGLGMLTILTIDLDRGLYAAEGSAVMADAQIVYGSQRSLYVATQRWINPATPAANLPSEPETVIDQFDASKPDRTPLVGSGVVPGYLLNQFSLSEHRGYLRVASTSRPTWWEGAQPVPSQSHVTVLANRGGALVQVGQISGLGAGQKIYSVRFIGDAGYVVTFRQVDPLYTIDLSSPTAPRVAGQLELEGYSAYLHPIGEGLLLGIGREVRSGNEPSSTQLELFDVSSPSAPRLQARTSLGGGSFSQVQFDHHAFLFWPPSSLAVLPVSIYPTLPRAVAPVPPQPGGGGKRPLTAEPTRPFVGAVAFRVDRSGISEVGRLAHDPIDTIAPAVERSLVIGSRLFTLSSEGVMASSLSTLERQAFVWFPLPTPVAGG